MTFASIPAEIADNIFEKLRTPDLYSICLVSRRFHQICLPYLYKKIIIFLDSGNNVLPQFKSLLRLDKARFQFTKVLGVRRRRLYYRGEASSYLDLGRASKNRLSPLRQSLLPYLQLVEHNSLHSFNYDLCLYALRDIMDQSGVLYQHQQSLKHLNLYTSEDDRLHVVVGTEIVLTGLSSLQSFAWSQPTNSREFLAVRNCLELNRSHLHSLHLRLSKAGTSPFNSLDRALEGEEDPNLTAGPFASHILALKKGQSSCLFPSLAYLSLEDVFLYPSPVELIHALNFKALRTLILYSCQYSMELLDSIVSTKLELKLAHFELYVEVLYSDSLTERFLWQTVGNFLASFQGLENLYLTIPGPADWDWVCNSINRQHCDTLRRFVFHERRRSSTEFEESDDYEIDWTEAITTTAYLPNLDFLGTSGDVQSVLEALDQQKTKRKTSPSIRVLHIRYSKDWQRIRQGHHIAFDSFGTSDMDSKIASTYSHPNDNFPPGVEYIDPDLFESANVAFGPNGLPSLQIIACGDFTIEGRLAGQNVLLCSNEQQDDHEGVSYVRKLKKSDTFLTELVRENMQVLEVCFGGRRASNVHL